MNDIRRRLTNPSGSHGMWSDVWYSYRGEMITLGRLANRLGISLVELLSRIRKGQFPE
jgi:hypothetical protein